MAGKKQTLTIRYATSADSDRLTNFRISQFKTAKEFEILDLKSLSKQSGAVYIVELDGELISTMQFEVVSNYDNLQILTHTHVPKQFNLFNTVYLSKAATTKEHRNSGLNSILRKLTLISFLNDASINSLTGIAHENAPRVHLIEKLGYKFTDVNPLNFNYAVPRGRVFFIELERERFNKAISFLQDETAELNQQFQIILQTEST